MKLASISIICLIFIFWSCSTQKDEEKTFTLGKYIYEDDSHVIHSNENCIKLLFGGDNNGKSNYAKHLVDTLNFVIPDINKFRVCSMCVNDEIYEKLLEISNRNDTIDIDFEQYRIDN